MREHILSCLVFVAACSKGDAQPAASSKPVEAAPAPAAEPVAKAPVAKAPAAKPAPKPVLATEEPPPVFPRPKADPAKAREIGMKVLTAISRKAEDIPLEINRKFVDVQISPATGKKIEKAFCHDSDTTAWQKLPKQIATRYGARIASADPDTIRCDAHDFLIFCQLSSQDEHEPDVTFAIAPEGGELAGVVERETWMVDPDSARFKADLTHRDRMLAKATLDDCFQPESARGRE